MSPFCASEPCPLRTPLPSVSDAPSTHGAPLPPCVHPVPQLSLVINSADARVGTYVWTRFVQATWPLSLTSSNGRQSSSPSETQKSGTRSCTLLVHCTILNLSSIFAHQWSFLVNDRASDVVGLLLDAGATFTQNAVGNTPLHNAALITDAHVCTSRSFALSLVLVIT